MTRFSVFDLVLGFRDRYQLADTSLCLRSVVGIVVVPDECRIPTLTVNLGVKSALLMVVKVGYGIVGICPCYPYTCNPLLLLAVL